MESSNHATHSRIKALLIAAWYLGVVGGAAWILACPSVHRAVRVWQAP